MWIADVMRSGWGRAAARGASITCWMHRDKDAMWTQRTFRKPIYIQVRVSNCCRIYFSASGGDSSLFLLKSSFQSRFCEYLTRKYQQVVFHKAQNPNQENEFSSSLPHSNKPTDHTTVFNLLTNGSRLPSERVSTLCWYQRFSVNVFMRSTLSVCFSSCVVQAAECRSGKWELGYKYIQHLSPTGANLQRFWCLSFLSIARTHLRLMRPEWDHVTQSKVDVVR